MWAGLQVAFIGALGLAFILTGVLQLYRSKIVWTPRRLPSPFYFILAGLFAHFLFISVVFMYVRYVPEPRGNAFSGSEIE